MTNTAIITGASQGIGKATGLLFARHNYDVVLAARQLDRLEATAAQIQIRELEPEAIALFDSAIGSNNQGRGYGNNFLVV